MYKYTLDQVNTPAAITKIIEDFEINCLPRFALLEKYYLVKNKILDRQLSDEKPNNRIAHGYARYITNMAASYFMGKPARYLTGDDAFKALLDGVLDDNYTNDTNFELAKESSKKGIAFELLFIDETGNLRTSHLRAEDVIPIYSPKIGEFLEAALRVWETKDIAGAVTKRCELYTGREIISFEKGNRDKEYRETGRKAHMLSDIPVIVYWNNEEQTGDYEDVISLIDAYDKAQSDTANDNEYFTDAYLTISAAGGGLAAFNAEGDGDEDRECKEAIKALKQERILFLQEKGQAAWLTKDVNDTAVENFKTRVHDDIFFVAQVPAMTDESFAGNLTGVALRYKFTGLEQLSVMKENKFGSAQKKKLRIVTD
jgi:SPP1 family phage portal protein